MQMLIALAVAGVLMLAGCASVGESAPKTMVKEPAGDGGGITQDDLFHTFKMGTPIKSDEGWTPGGYGIQIIPTKQAFPIVTELLRGLPFEELEEMLEAAITVQLEGAKDGGACSILLRAGPFQNYRRWYMDLRRDITKRWGRGPFSRESEYTIWVLSGDPNDIAVIKLTASASTRSFYVGFYYDNYNECEAAQGILYDGGEGRVDDGSMALSLPFPPDDPCCPRICPPRGLPLCPVIKPCIDPCRPQIWPTETPPPGCAGGGVRFSGYPQKRLFRNSCG